MTDIDQLQADLDQAKEEIAGPVPTIEAAPDCVVDLLRGLPFNGKVHKRAEVRELTGIDEEALARYKKPEEVFDAVLAHGTVKIGDVDLASLPLGERQGILRTLLIGERDILFLNIARVTYGDERRFPVKCIVCGREQDLGVTLSEDFKATSVENIEGRGFTFTTSRGMKLEVRLATGEDQMTIFAKDGLSTAEMNTQMLSACILSVDDVIVVDPLNFARSLPMRDRQALVIEMVERQPSIDLTVKYPCFGCQEEQQQSFNWLDFFRL